MGEISDVCIKRKMRNRLQDNGQVIFVQSDDRADDDCKSLSDRAKKIMSSKISKEDYAKKACETWIDVRTFGQVFAFKGEKDDKDGVSVGVRGPVSIHQAISISPIEICSMQITKSVNSETKDKKSSDTMGMKHRVNFGLYEIKGSINVQLAEKTGFSDDDAELIKQSLISLFENDASSARPEGSMEVRKVFWWKHNCKSGQYSSAKVHRSLQIGVREGVSIPTSYEDYTISISPLDGLTPEEYNGL
jgi:CRISPR-associated protein Csd2